MNESVASNPVSTKPKTWLKIFIPIFAILLVIIALENCSGNFSTDIKSSNPLPADGWLVWASTRQEGRHEIYLAKADGSGIIRLTQNGAKHPTWSPDGSWISYEAADGSVHVMRPDKSEDKKLLDSGSAPFWMHDGSGLFVVEGSSYSLLDPETGSKKVLFKKSDFAKVAGKELHPSGITADGKFLVALSDLYRNGFAGDNGFFTAVWAAIILDLDQKDKVFFFGDGCEPTTPPSGSRIYHVFSGAGQSQCPSGLCPDIQRMDLADLANRSSYASEMAHADSDWGHEYFPRISTDGKWLSYGASTGCHDHDSCDYEIFIHLLGADNSDRQRVTNDPGSDQWPHLFIGELWKPQSQHRASR